MLGRILANDEDRLWECWQWNLKSGCWVWLNEGNSSKLSLGPYGIRSCCVCVWLYVCFLRIENNGSFGWNFWSLCTENSASASLDPIFFPRETIVQERLSFMLGLCDICRVLVSIASGLASTA